MDWIVFGDDWGAHPSTTQHFVTALPDTDRVIWINSMGMRAPQPTAADFSRVARAAARALGSEASEVTSAPRPPMVIETTRLPVAPWHRHRGVRWMNRRAVRQHLGGLLLRHGFDRPVVLSSSPVAAFYLDEIAPRSVGYLCLDDYARLPGVDPALIDDSEPEMRARADAVFVTARALERGGDDIYLPQGVDVEHFARACVEGEREKTIGFFGLVESWVDVELIIAAARGEPEWTFELIGEVRHGEDALLAQPNVRCRGRVPYQDLPEAIRHWRGAWIPFVVNALTEAVNPLKAREYLAAGLPVFSTPLPELLELERDITLGETAADVSRWIAEVIGQETPCRRAQRSRRADEHAWARRAEVLRSHLT